MRIKYASTILYKADLPDMPPSFIGVRIVGNDSRGLGFICFPVYSRPNRRTTLRYLDRFHTTSSLDGPLLLRKEQITGRYSAKELAAIRTQDKPKPRPKAKAERIHVERVTQYQLEHAAARERDLEDFYKGKLNRFERSWKKLYHGGSCSSK